MIKDWLIGFVRTFCELELDELEEADEIIGYVDAPDDEDKMLTLPLDDQSFIMGADYMVGRIIYLLETLQEIHPEEEYEELDD